MSTTPLPRAVAFIDGQNLIHDAEREFGYKFFNVDVKKLATVACGTQWQLIETRFYTGVPTTSQSYNLHQFWDKAIFRMKANGVTVEKFNLRERNSEIMLYKQVAASVRSPRDNSLESIAISPCWTTSTGKSLDHDTIITQPTWTEKGVDVSIAVDAINYAIEDKCDVFLLFSRDSDLSPVVYGIENIRNRMGSKLLVATVFPSNSLNSYGIGGADITLRLTKAQYDSCIDPKAAAPNRGNR